MSSLNAVKRHAHILGRLEAERSVSVRELSEVLGVTQVTIREDLRCLEGRGKLRRTRGGALAVPRAEPEAAPTSPEQPLRVTRQVNIEAKQAIGRRAAQLIQPGQKVFLDVGSTTTALAEAIPADAEDLTVITNSLNIAARLGAETRCTVMVSGGTLRPLQQSLVAPLGTLLIERLHADLAFIGCNGVDATRGITNSNLAEAEIKQAMIQAAGRVVVLADHTKLATVSSAFVAQLSAVHQLITDAAAPPALVAELTAAGLRVELADPSVPFF